MRNELECQRNENHKVCQELTETSEDLSRTKNALEETKGTSQVRFMSNVVSQLASAVCSQIHAAIVILFYFVYSDLCQQEKEFLKITIM